MFGEHATEENPAKLALGRTGARIRRDEVSEAVDQRGKSLVEPAVEIGQRFDGHTIMPRGRLKNDRNFGLAAGTIRLAGCTAHDAAARFERLPTVCPCRESAVIPWRFRRTATSRPMFASAIEIGASDLLNKICDARPNRIQRHRFPSFSIMLPKNNAGVRGKRAMAAQSI